MQYNIHMENTRKCNKRSRMINIKKVNKKERGGIMKSVKKHLRQKKNLFKLSVTKKMLMSLFLYIFNHTIRALRHWYGNSRHSIMDELSSF